MIELRHITKSYRQGKRNYLALDDINLSIANGQVFGIVGESGAGKSTLLRTINLLERPSSGEVIVDGNNLTALSSAALRKQRRNIGMIFQHFNLLESRTVSENVAFPLEM